MTDPPRFEIPQNKAGRFLWSKAPGFLEWFDTISPGSTLNELRKVLSDVVGVPVTRAMVRGLRDKRGVFSMPGTTKRAYQLRDNPVPTALRLLGPEDEEFFVHVTGDVAITGDWHVPYHDEALTFKLIEVCQALKITQLVINGDFLNEDAFSKWKWHPFNMDWETEKGIAHELVARLCRHFERIYYILDNHDRRIIAAHERPSQFSEKDVVQLLVEGTYRKQILASIYYHYVLVDNLFRITSPKEYRRQKLSLPERLARLHQQHVISGGDHLFGLGIDDGGRWIIANGMSMVSRKEVPYVNVQDTTFPMWNSGFYVIQNQVLHPFVNHPNLWPRWWEKAT